MRAYLGRPELMELMINNGANVNYTDRNNNQTLLHWASYTCNVIFIQC